MARINNRFSSMMMVHLLEPTHNKQFAALMDHFLPTWQHLRHALNDYPLRHEKWQY